MCVWGGGGGGGCKSLAILKRWGVGGGANAKKMPIWEPKLGV